MGSNGFISVCYDVFVKYLVEKYFESYDKVVFEELVYSGNLKLIDVVEGSLLDVGKLVFLFICIYVLVVKKLLDVF